MNNAKSRLPVIAAVLGAAACILRFGLYRTGTDAKGLLIPGHPLAIALWLLSGGAALFLVWQAWKQKGSRKYAANFPAGTLPAIGCILFAAGLFATVLANRQVFTAMERIRNAAGLLAVPALVAVAIFRSLGKRPPFGFHAVVCLALTLHTVSFYRIWCSHPQLVDSFFPMAGCILLMLFTYYQTAFDVDLGKRRMQLGTGLLAAFFCFAAIPESSAWLLYLTGGIFTLTNLCALHPATDKEEEK